MLKFNVGDRIIGNEKADRAYSLTRKGVICIVETISSDIPSDISSADIGVRIVYSPFHISNADMYKTWYVDAEYFDIYKGNEVSTTNTSFGGIDMSNKSRMEYTFTTEEYKEFKSAGKGSHKGYTVDKIKTIVTMDGKTGVAVINKEDYNERQGILEALGNMMYGNFDREYDKLLHKRKMAYKADCKCSICGIYKDTPEDARACELAHDERRRKKFDAYVLRKEAIKRIKEADKEHKIEEIMTEIYEKRKKDKESSETKKPAKQKKPGRRKKDINSDES